MPASSPAGTDCIADAAPAQGFDEQDFHEALEDHVPARIFGGVFFHDQIDDAGEAAGIGFCGADVNRLRQKVEQRRIHLLDLESSPKHAKVRCSFRIAMAYASV